MKRLAQNAAILDKSLPPGRPIMHCDSKWPPYRRSGLLLPMILFYDRISKRFEAARARNQWLPVGRLFPVDFPLAALNKVFPRTSLSPVRERKLAIGIVCLACFLNCCDICIQGRLFSTTLMLHSFQRRSLLELINCLWLICLYSGIE